MHESYAKDVVAKDNLIQRLKSIKESLESEVEGLRAELLKVKEECDRHVKEKHVENVKIITAKSKVSYSLQTICLFSGSLVLRVCLFVWLLASVFTSITCHFRVWLFQFSVCLFICTSLIFLFF